MGEWVRPVIEDGKPTKYGWIVRHPDRFELEEDTDIGAFTYIQAEYGVRIERGAQIGSHCALYSRSTIDGKRGAVLIEEGACVGSHCTVMPGVTVGARAVVGAHSFVTRDVEPNATVYGVPAKLASAG